MPKVEPLRVLTLTPDEVFDPAYRELFDQLAEHDLDRLPLRTVGSVKQCVRDADVVIGDWSGELLLDATTIAAASRCRAILQPTTGFETIDTTSAAAFGIPVSHTPGVNATAVAEWVIMASLAMLKAVPRMHRRVDRGEWGMVQAGREGVYEIAGSTVGIVGFGKIGQSVARRLGGFDIGKILYYDILPPDVENQRNFNAQRVELNELFECSDVVTLHVPLNEHTRGLIGTQQLRRLGPAGVLVNTARAGVVDYDALFTALTTGTIKAAALDVFDVEPLTANHRWIGLENVLLSPHLAGSTNKSRIRMVWECLHNLDRVLQGLEPTNVVNGVSPVQTPIPESMTNSRR